jgi:Ca2+-binding RTX toxin-like protein
MELLFILLGTLGVGLGMVSFMPEAATDDLAARPEDDPNRTVSSGDIYGGPDDNTLRAVGNGTAHGGQGFDTIWASEESTAYGGAGQDSMVLWGDATGYGGWGADTLIGSGTSDVFGGIANDVLTIGKDAIGYGGAGNDTLNARGESWGDEGDDFVDINIPIGTAVSIYGGAGDDTMKGAGTLDSTVYGGLGDDLITSDGFLAMGDAGNDTIVNAYSGGGGVDLVFGGDGNDSLSGDTTHYGGDGDDTIFAEMGRGYGDSGNDRVTAQYAYGGEGNDALRLLPFSGEGYLSRSEAYGGDGDDTLHGALDYTYEAGGAKILSGGAGNDLIYAKGGEHVDAGAGNDTVFAYTASFAETTNVTLGDGADDLVMTLAPTSGNDTGEEMGSVIIQDFNPANDHLALILAPSNAAGLQYIITPNLAGGNTEAILTLSGASVIYDFQGITSLSAGAIKLYADEAAVAAGTSYQTLA